ncbi:MAG: hypothetical protein IID41_04700 [Planctomycetes bacterium]|nr:hypothetical protein [Planctomycetota bacterium]
MTKRRVMTIPALILALGSAQLLAQEDGDSSRRRRGMRERMMRDDNAPKVGDVAPVFTIKSLDGKSETDLASFKGKKPVLLFFGSYT